MSILMFMSYVLLDFCQIDFCDYNFFVCDVVDESLNYIQGFFLFC